MVRVWAVVRLRRKIEDGWTMHGCMISGSRSYCARRLATNLGSLLGGSRDSAGGSAGRRRSKGLATPTRYNPTGMQRTSCDAVHFIQHVYFSLFWTSLSLFLPFCWLRCACRVSRTARRWAGRFLRTIRLISSPPGLVFAEGKTKTQSIKNAFHLLFRSAFLCF